MLRSFPRHVSSHRSTYLAERQLLRLISTFPNQKSTAANNTPSPSLSNQIAPRKVKLGLRPCPVKPKDYLPPVTTVPTKSTDPSLLPSSAPSSRAVKDVSKLHMEKASAHGVFVPPPPGANWFRKTVHKGIQLAKFYYRGVKLIFVRRKEVSLIRDRVRTGGTPLTRPEYRLMATQRSDVRKVIPFILIALILEEVIPVIAIYMPSMLPSTCILPSQRIRIEEKKTEKAISFSTVYRPMFSRLKAQENPPGFLPLETLRKPQVSEAICGILRLPTIGVDTLRIRRIYQHLEFLAQDDRLLLCHQSPLSERDLNEALEERGIIIQGLTFSDKQTLLKRWLDLVRDVDVEAQFCRRLSLIVAKQLEDGLNGQNPVH